MLVASHQPSFLPWVGYYHKMLVADQFFYMEGVQYPRRSYVNRTFFQKTWMTVPCRKTSVDTTLDDVQVAEEKRTLSVLMDRIGAYRRSRVCKYKSRLDGVIRQLQLIQDQVEKGSELGLSDLNKVLDSIVLKQLSEGKQLSMIGDVCKNLSRQDRLNMYAIGVNPPKFYLAGKGAALGYLGQEPLSDFDGVFVQKECGEIRRWSILEVLGEEESPREYVLNAFMLVPLAAYLTNK